MDSYEGLRAGEAIVAVRERGLRPSLERTEGAAPDVHGFVVSQEPVAGSEVPAESQVFLYIGAPARTVRDGALPVHEPALTEPPEDATVELAREQDGDPEAAAPVDDSLADDESVEESWAEDGPGDEDLADAEFIDDEAADEDEDEWFEEAEPTRVWRKPEPEAARQGWRRRGVPVGVKVAAVGLVACLALTVLLSLAARFEGGAGGRRSEARRGSPAAVPSGIGANGHGAATRKAAAHRSQRRPVRHRRGGGVAHAAGSPRTVVVVVRVPAPAAVPVARGPSTAEESAAEASAAEQLHVEREFGP